MEFQSPPRRMHFTAETVPPSPSRSQLSGVPGSPAATSPGPSSIAASPGLLERIMERKRAALGDLSNNVDASAVSGRRTRARLEITTGMPVHLTGEEESGDKVAVQRFTLVSRGAAPAKRRAAAQQCVLVAPPRVAAQLGAEVQVCRCSECDRSGLR